MSSPPSLRDFDAIANHYTNTVTTASMELAVHESLKRTKRRTTRETGVAVEVRWTASLTLKTLQEWNAMYDQCLGRLQRETGNLEAAIRESKDAKHGGQPISNIRKAEAELEKGRRECERVSALKSALRKDLVAKEEEERRRKRLRAIVDTAWREDLTPLSYACGLGNHGNLEMCRFIKQALPLCQEYP